MSTRWSRRAVGHLLVMATTGLAPPSELQQKIAGCGPAVVEELLLAATRHGVTRWVAEALLAARGLDAEARRSITGSANRVLRDHLRTTSQLPMISQALDELGTPWLAFKGPVLAELAYRRPDLREYVDLDIMVPPEALTEVLHGLERLGCRFVGRDWSTLRRDQAGQLSLQAPGGVLLDLHWELFNDPRIRRSFRFPGTHDLLATGQRLRINDVDVLTLNPIDTVVHTALHACVSGGWRLLWLKDLEQALLAAESDADEIAARAHEWGAGLAVAVMLQRAVRVLGFTPPEGLMPALARQSAWSHALAAVDRLAPIEQRTGAGSLTRVVTHPTRSTRRTTGRSTVELARRTGEFAYGHMLRALPERGAAQAPRDDRLRREFLTAVQQRASQGKDSPGKAGATTQG